MGRIKVVISGKKLFQTCIPVRITDVNYGNHLGNDAMVSILHEARVQWLHSLSFSELNFHGISLILAGLAVEYKKEAFYGDVLDIIIFSGEKTQAGFELFYEIRCERNGHMLLIGNAKTEMVCFDYDSKKVCSLPSAAESLF